MNSWPHVQWLTALRLLAGLMLGLGVAGELVAQTAADEGRQLVWEDTFDGPTLDFSKWEIERNAFGGGNHELQIYTERRENVRVDDGKLILEARRDHADILGTRREYSSGRVRTKHRGDWKYGRIDVFAKLPQGQGLWPAIWMLPSGDFSEDFHLFSVDWQEGKIRWFIDNHLVQTQTKWSSTGGEYPAPFDQRFHLLLNLAVGGEFLGPPDDTTAFPARLEVDFVRVYQ